MKTNIIKKPSYNEIVKNVIASSKIEGIYLNKDDIIKIKNQLSKDLKANSR